MFCNKCGAQLPDGSKFCNKCGATIKGVSQEKAVETPVAATPEASSVTPTLQGGVSSVGATTASEETPAKVSRTARIAIVSVAAAVLLICLGIIFYLRFVSVVVIDESRFPDQNFRSFVTAKMDTNNDGVLSHDEVAAVTDIDLTEQTDVNDVTGIVVFTELQTFNLGANTVEEVDLSKNSHVSKVSTGAGSASSIKLPSGFDLEAGLDGAPGAEIQSGSTVIQADEWTTSNGGQFGPIQRYNGTLYVGKLHLARSEQLRIDGATTFFGNTDSFYFANGKAYWVDNDPGNGNAHVSLYSADIDGSNKQTIAQDVISHEEIYYVDDVIVFQTWANNVLCVNTKTGERSSLPNSVFSPIGVYKNNLVVPIKGNAPVNVSNPYVVLGLYNPSTKELTRLSIDYTEKTNVPLPTTSGILFGDLSNATLIGQDGRPVWKNEPLIPSGITKNKTFGSVFSDEKSYYTLYPVNQDSRTFRLDAVSQADAEHNPIDFVVPEVTDQSNASGEILFTDSKGAFVAIIQTSIGTSYSGYFYYVPFSDGEAKYLYQLV